MDETPQKTSRWWMWRAMIVTYVLWFVSFYAVGNYAATLETVDLTTPVDELIPVVPAFVWPYEVTYVLPFFAPLLIRDDRRFIRAIFAIAVASVTAYVMYLLLPVAFPRPVLGDSLAEKILQLEYSLDFHPGANKLPSLHVAHAWILFFAFRGPRLGKWGETAALGLTLLITISTLFVKQHVILDVIAGVLWAWAAWIISAKIKIRSWSAS